MITRKTMLVFGLALTITFVLCIVMVNVANDKAEAPSEPVPAVIEPAQQQVNEKRYSYPKKLIIESIGVNAEVQYVSLTDEQDLDVPNNHVDVGWYKLGTRPGNPGSAVIDGHVIGPKGESGVFNKLDTLQKGDIVTVLDSKKNTVRFSVVKVKSYSFDERPDEVFKQSDISKLNLITCSGEWNENARNYSQRTVVFTERID